MENKASLRLLILFLGFSFVLSSVAVPISRSLKSINKEDPSVHDLMAQAIQNIRDNRELSEVEEAYIEGRMDAASTDYPGTGANNHHDPKTPGRA